MKTETNVADAERLAYNIEDACEVIGVSRTTLYDLMAAGELTSIKIRRRRLIPASVVVAYLERLIAEQAGRGLSA